MSLQGRTETCDQRKDKCPMHGAEQSSIVTAWRFAWSATPVIAANRSHLLSGSVSAESLCARSGRLLVRADAALVQSRCG